jgi:hypothetical protein
MLATEAKTNIFKSVHHGWTAETIVRINDAAYEIHTGKGIRGGIRSFAQKGTLKGGTFSFMMFSDERIELATMGVPCTEKSITELHNKALIKFDELKATERAAPAPYKVDIGQILFTDMIHSADRNERAVYEIKPDGDFLTVTLDGTDMLCDSHVRPYSQKFGIGVYYNEGECITPAEVIDLMTKAKLAILKRQEDQQIQETQSAAIRADKIALGRPLVNIPTDATHIIIAELKEDHSDLMTDYYHAITKQIIYLAYSTHKRDLFSEMRKAAIKFDETKHLAIAPADDVEQKEKYTGGYGYYLGESRYRGWIVSKARLTDYQSEIITEATKENLYIAAAEGRYLCQAPEPIAASTPVEPAKSSDLNIELLDYSAKAIVVTGDTKTIKDQLKSLGGKFNGFLTHPYNGTKFAGWIFSKRQTETIKQTLNLA